MGLGVSGPAAAASDVADEVDASDTSDGVRETTRRAIAGGSTPGDAAALFAIAGPCSGPFVWRDSVAAAPVLLADAEATEEVSRGA